MDKKTEIVRWIKLIWALSRAIQKSTLYGSNFGVLWYLVVPAFQVCIYYVLIVIIYRGGEQSVEFLSVIVAGVTHFQIVTLLQTNTGSILMGNGSILKSINIPPVTFIIAGFLRSIIMFLPSVSVGIVFLLIRGGEGYFSHMPSYLVAVIGLLMTSWPIALLTAVGTLYIRDIERLYPLGCQVMMYSCPVIYHVSFIPAGIESIYYLNPMAVIFGWIQYGLIGGGHPPLIQTLVACILIIILNITAYCVYRILKNNITKQL